MQKHSGPIMKKVEVNYTWVVKGWRVTIKGNFTLSNFLIYTPFFPNSLNILPYCPNSNFYEFTPQKQFYIYAKICTKNVHQSIIIAKQQKTGNVQMPTEDKL